MQPPLPLFDQARCGPDLPPGFGLIPDVLTIEEEQSLIAHLQALPFREFTMRGVAARRQVIHYGWDYGYETWQITPTDPFPSFLAELRDRLVHRAGLEPTQFVEALLTCYRPGAGIGWHRDAPSFDEPVIGLSLSAPCRMRFRNAGAAGQAFSVVLPPRAMYLLRGPSRWTWQHSIPPVKSLRYSITFRRFKIGATPLSSQSKSQ